MSETTIKEISSQQAWEILEAEPQAVLLDVRTSMEYEYVGHPLNALHVPWMDAPDWNIDTGFVDKVRQVLAKRTGSDQGLGSIPILAICRSGKRSQAAAEELARYVAKAAASKWSSFSHEPSSEYLIRVSWSSI